MIAPVDAEVVLRDALLDEVADDRRRTISSNGVICPSSRLPISRSEHGSSAMKMIAGAQGDVHQGRTAHLDALLDERLGRRRTTVMSARVAADDVGVDLGDRPSAGTRCRRELAEW